MRSLLLGLLASVSMAMSASAQTTYEYARSNIEGGSMRLLMDYHEGGRGCAAPRPTVVFIHGGGFRSGSRTGAARNGTAAAFNDAGINVASIDYRKDGDNPVPSAPYAAMLSGAAGSSTQRYEGQALNAVAAMEDTNKALQYLVANAGRLCVNTREIFLMGSSAGAVTALNVAYSFDEAGIRRPSIEGVIDLWGGGMPASSIDPGSVPLFIAHGERDPTVPFAFADAFYNRATAVGVPVQLHAFANKQHGFDTRRTRVNGTPVLTLAVEFVQDIVAGRRIETVRTRTR